MKLYGRIRYYRLTSILVIFGMVGCTATRDLSQSELRVDADHDITVTTKDGRVIQFQGGGYQIVDENFGSIAGEGLIIIYENQFQYKPFEGTISFSEIHSITESYTPTYAKVGAVVTVSAVALLVLFAVGLGGGVWH